MVKEHRQRVIDMIVCSYAMNVVMAYDGAGTKLRAQYGVQACLAPLTPLSGREAGQESGCTAGPDDPAGLLSPDEMNRVDYCGNVVYDFGTTRLLTDEGYVTFDELTGAPQYHYYQRDHLALSYYAIGKIWTGNCWLLIYRLFNSIHYTDLYISSYSKGKHKPDATLLLFSYNNVECKLFDRCVQLTYRDRQWPLPGTNVKKEYRRLDANFTVITPKRKKK